MTSLVFKIQDGGNIRIIAQLNDRDAIDLADYARIVLLEDVRVIQINNCEDGLPEWCEEKYYNLFA